MSVLRQRSDSYVWKNQHKTFCFDISETYTGIVGLRGQAIASANPDCLRLQIDVAIIGGALASHGKFYVPSSGETLQVTRILPDSLARPQPEFIPSPLREDYSEAWKIRDLSPKASATLSRRCLQGMIRDLAGVHEKTLFKEIEKLRELSEKNLAPKGVSEDSIESLHHVRSLGNIGAHMEADIDIVIPVDPKEAQILIDLIEILFDEWYVAREKRRSKFAALKATADEKQLLKTDTKAIEDQSGSKE